MLKKLTRVLVGLTAAGLAISMIPDGISMARSAYLDTTRAAVNSSVNTTTQAPLEVAQEASLGSTPTTTPYIEQVPTEETKARVLDIPKSTKTINTAEVLASNPEETIFTIMETQSGVPWGLDRVDGTVDGLYSYKSSGLNTRIYIVDTGIDASHREFGSRVVDGFDAFGENLDQTDCQGHGTHVAGIAAGNYYGVAKSATLVPVRVLDCRGVGTTTTLTSGIEWILTNHSGGTGIVNMSLGGSKDEEVNAATARLISAGFVVVSAAGNSNVDACGVSPASTPGVIAVGAIDSVGAKASFSNWGSCVDILAPGVGINSANSVNHNVSLKRSGTSQASPFVAGAIATYISSGSLASSYDAQEYLDEMSVDNVVSVEQEEAPVPVPVVEPAPEVIEPESPPADPTLDPIGYEVSVVQEGIGSYFGSLSWTKVESATRYDVYKTGSIRPGWRLFATANGDVTTMTISDKPGAIAVYSVVAIVGGKSIDLGEFTYYPES